MLIIGLIGCLFFLWVSWDILRDIAAPPFILSGIWTFVYLTLFFRGDYVDQTNPNYLLFLYSLAFYVFGFFSIIDRVRVRKRFVSNDFSVYEVKKISKVFYVLISLILVLILYQKIRTLFALHYFENPLQTISKGGETGDFDQGLLLEYGRNFIFGLTVFFGALYFHNPVKANKFPFVIMLPISMLFVLTAGNRGTIFLFILALFFVFFFFGVTTKRRKRKVMLRLLLFILVVFVFTSYWKFTYSDQYTSKEFIVRIFNIYFTMSPIAFVEWMDTNTIFLHGDNSFRFFHAIMNSFGANYPITDPVLDFVKIDDDFTNTFTILRFYIADYGIWYLFVIQFVLGSIYGRLYRSSFFRNKINFYSRIMLSFLYFPLVYQFFDDRYLSLLSTWIQFMFWTWLFTKYLIKEIPYDRIK